MEDGLFGNFITKTQTVSNGKPKPKERPQAVKLKDKINLASSQLFGNEFKIDDLTAKLKPSVPTASSSAEQILKSKKLSLAERLSIINTKVLSVLGKQKANVLVIKTKEQLHEYITAAILSGRISIDTETNNSLDPITCKLMGPCFYYPGGKQAYVPLNHRNPDTKERLAWQLTEEDCKQEFQRIVESKLPVIMHNGKFDYEVIKCTCSVPVIPFWDTMIAARLLNENEKASLKQLFIKYIDQSQEKYDIEKLFDNISYADVDPDIFALYAATDAYMTDKLYELQKIELDKPEYGPHMDLLGIHEIKGLRWVFHKVEMPISIVTAEMELLGVEVDEEYGQRLKDKYSKQLTSVDTSIENILVLLKPVVDAWKLTPAANTPTKIYVAKNTKMSQQKIEATFTHKDETGVYKIGKARVDQLSDPINLSSPSQLAILFYDILGVPNNARDGSRKTGKDELKIIKERLAKYLPKLEEIETELELDEEEDEDLDDIETAVEMSQDELEVFRFGNAAKLASLILQRRTITKLVTTYIEVIPDLVKHWPDRRIRFHLNSLGTDTGRYSSGGKLKFMENDEAITVSGINIQNIPAHNPEVRMLFKARPGYRIIGSDYSAQEPRMTTFLSGSKKMYEAYTTGKDLYAIIAQSAFHNNYEDNLEYYPEGTELEIDGKKIIAGHKTHLNKAGKSRRSTGKVLNLSCTYGMSARTAGIKLGYSEEEAAEEGGKLLNSFFTDFHEVKTAIDQSQAFLKKNGYVEDFIGRRRRLTNINLEPYKAEFKTHKTVNANFNPFLICKDREDASDPSYVWNQILKGYIILSNAWHLSDPVKYPNYVVKNEIPNMTFEKLRKVANNPSYYFDELYDTNKKPSAWNRKNKEKILDDMQAVLQILIDRTYKNDVLPENADFESLLAQYETKYGRIVPTFLPDEPMNLTAWTGLIAAAARQCFNARIQGSAASLTKMAMIDIFNDPQLKAWDAKLIITVHDEVLVECPEQYAELVEKRLPEIMIETAKKVGNDVPQACDPYNVTRWYSDVAATSIIEEFKKLELQGLSRDEALDKVIKNHTEVPSEAIVKTIETGCDLDF